MTMLREFREPTAREAEENLRVIRELMERSTKFSTFSGLSGIMAGTASIVGCLATRSLQQQYPNLMRADVPFLLTWSLVILFAVGVDFLLTKRHAARVGKRIVSRLGKQMAFASIPGLGTGALLTLYLLRHNLVADVFPIWMLCYGIAVCAVGLFSQREVKILGVSFLAAGAVTMLFPQIGLAMMAFTFGGFHIVYGLIMARKDGW
jgi:hypothetical protein